MGAGRGKYGTESGVGGDRVVDGIQLEKRSRRLEMDESCSWWTEAEIFVMAHDRNLSKWTMQSTGERVGWVR